MFKYRYISKSAYHRCIMKSSDIFYDLYDIYYDIECIYDSNKYNDN